MYRKNCAGKEAFYSVSALLLNIAESILMSILLVESQK
jgi:hypothetical protein